MVLASHLLIATEGHVDQELAQVGDLLLKAGVRQFQQVLQDDLVNDWAEMLQLLLEFCLVEGAQLVFIQGLERTMSGTFGGVD